MGLVATALPGRAQEAPEFGEAWVRIELNATDGDAGFQAMADADGWRKVKILDPDRRPIYKVKGLRSVRAQGLTENFFESAEPPCSEQALEEFLQRFAPGKYRFRGITNDEEPLKGSSTLTHELPGAPENLAPTGGGIDATGPVTVSWVPGDTLGNCPAGAAQLTPPGQVPLHGYELIVIREVPAPALELVIDVPPGQTSVTLPAEFMMQAAVYKFEVIAIEARLNEDDEEEKGNQSITEGLFCTAGIDPCEVPE